MFLPQVAAAIVAALAGGRLSDRFGAKRVYQAGLAASLIAMAVLYGSQFVESDLSIAYPMLLVATALVGVGFGLTVPALIALTATSIRRRSTARPSSSTLYSELVPRSHPFS